MVNHDAATVMIDTDNLGRYFGSIRAVDGVSFTVRQGEVLGFLGPNGAGKSTTMKLLTCFLSPSFGTARVGGYDISTDSRKVRELIGYLPENSPLYGEMRVREFLSFVAEVRGLDRAKLRGAVDRVVEMTSLEGVTTQQIDTLSKGFRRRVGLAQSLLHDPEILILDEPTDGLDPNQKHEVRLLIKSMAAHKCIILSTHILEEVDEVCSRVVIIARGKIVADSTPDELRRYSATSGAVTVVFDARHRREEVLPLLERLPGVRMVEEAQPTPGRSSYILFPHTPQTPILHSVVREAEGKGLRIADLRLDAGQLDDVFRQITT